MANQTTICNIALSHISQKKIQNIDQQNDVGAEACKLHYDTARRFLQTKFNWNFNKKVEALALTATDPFGWDFEYQKPVSLRIRSLAPEGGTDLVRSFSGGEMVYSPALNSQTPVLYDIVGDKIVTNLEDAFAIYSIDITSEALFEESFTNVLTWYLAFMISLPVTGKLALRDRAEKGYKEALIGATAISANSRSVASARTSELVRARQ